MGTKEKFSARKVRSRYKHSLNEILAHFSAPDNTSIGAVHDFRVNLKRVDALIALLRFNDQKLSHRKLTTFRSLFKLAGKLRSVQVEYDIVGKYFGNNTSNPNYLHELHEKKVRRLKKYEALLEAGPPAPLVRAIRLLKKTVDALTARHVRRYLNAEENVLARRLKQNVFREQRLHLIRKELKRYYLNLKIAERPNDAVEKLLELLGNWHDHQVAFDHVVKVIYDGHYTAAECEPVKQIKSGLIEKKEDFYEKIVSFYSIDMHSSHNLKDPVR
ncbi:MAG: CHAD domain-containing protein [Bacteroidia bacterium]|nr:CHAD domain-containing protein [Bacteroidia bacterium]